MHTLALVVFALMAAAPVELAADVYEWRERAFGFPIGLGADQRAGISHFRLLVSEDRGRTWRHEGDYGADTKLIRFDAPDDGLYWFGLQLVFKDGTATPADVKQLKADRKVFVNTNGRPVVMKKEYAVLQAENEALRRRIAELEQKLDESGRKPK
ncbi:hypothetical protein R5W23_002907 [Gemmata sp. JC673]|uniref:Uncharacterized protein n=1 Tax=Gemmata algarum TaxID=2975278 RepID=A0ABU5F5U4_9BACT|nr:hypothetical protein [Gemmata algarum]MDY3561628.1 hypothetical protein [Gemmata algarum]